MNTPAVFAHIAAACAAALAGAALARRKRTLARWAFAAGMLVIAAESLFQGLSASALYVLDMQQWQQWRTAALSVLPLPWLLFSCTYGRAARRKWLTVDWIVLGAGLLLPVGYLWLRGDSFGFARSFETIGTGTRLGPTGRLLHTAVLVGSVITLLNLERTFRAAIGTMRWRIKYVLMGVGVLFAVRIYTSSQALIFHRYNPTLDSLNSAAVVIAAALLIRGLLRAGNFEFDVYPSGPLLQNSLTVLLAGIYLLIVGLGAKLVAFLGGDSAFSLKAFAVLVALVALALAVQSDRLRVRLRHWVSRHFERPLHDYAGVWRKFTQATASRVQKPELCSGLVAIVSEVFQVLSVRLWLLNDRRDRFDVIKSTTDERVRVAELPAAELLAQFEKDPTPANIDRTDRAWCAAVRSAHPTQFPNGGDRLCVPLIARGEVLGLLTIGDRVSGMPFTPQDIELLKCMAEQAAASVLNVKLSEQLVQAKQLEAFQSMAAFFVHDLKNAASTLNLTLQNLPQHYGDPEFRSEALRGLSKTCGHINQLIERLTALRRELKIQPTLCDLNELVREALSTTFTVPDPRLHTDMHPLPRLPLDREQFEKVVTNLVLNASEATPPTGHISVATSQQNGSVVLTVTDDGCGMSEDFMTHSLFRPFQTTKKSGLGIGMFQTKMIVEAHGGRIAVSSEPGRGSRFQVFFHAPAGLN